MADPSVFATVVLDPLLNRNSKAVMSMRLIQKEYHHDMVEVVLRGEHDDLTEFRTGSPVRIDFGRYPKQEDAFFGYLNHVEPVVDREHPELSSRLTKVLCIGASYVMKQPITGVFTNRTAQGVVLDVAQQFLFTADIPFANIDIVFPSLSCPGHTAWAFCSETAKKAGLVFYCNKTEARMYDPLVTLHRFDRFLPTFYHRDSFPNTDSIIRFEVESGDYFPQARRHLAKRLAYGVNSRTGEMVFATNEGAPGAQKLARNAPTPQFSKYETGLVVGDQYIAAQRLDAEANQNRFHVQATAEVIGDPNVHQGAIVVMEGLGDKHSGLWYVHEAVHNVSFERYSTSLVLGRDSEYDDGVRPGPPVNVVRTRFDPFDQQQVRETPPSVLVNNVWRSAWLAKKSVTA